MTSRRELTRLGLLNVNSLWYAFLGFRRIVFSSPGFDCFRDDSLFAI
jgi:hypothetical protein